MGGHEMEMLAIDRGLIDRRHASDPGRFQTDSMGGQVVGMTVDATGVVGHDRVDVAGDGGQALGRLPRRCGGEAARRRFRSEARVGVPEELQAVDLQRCRGRFGFQSPDLGRRRRAVVVGGDDDRDADPAVGEPGDRAAGEDRLIIGMGVKEEDTGNSRAV